MLSAGAAMLMAVLATGAGGVQAFGPAQPPHVLSIIVDDLGRYDTQVTNPAAPTPTIGRLAKEGIKLDRHYAYM